MGGADVGDAAITLRCRGTSPSRGNRGTTGRCSRSLARLDHALARPFRTEFVPPCRSLLAVNRHRASPHREARPAATTPRRPEMRAHGRKYDMGKRFAILIGVAAAGVMALGAQTGAAASESVVKYDTRLTITTDRNIPHGRVHSEVRKCEFGRRVILFKKRPGPDRKLDTARMFGNVWWA